MGCRGFWLLLFRISGLCREDGYHEDIIESMVDMVSFSHPIEKKLLNFDFKPPQPHPSLSNSLLLLLSTSSS